jgi:AmmeMemoRadiSam system protein B
MKLRESCLPAGWYPGNADAINRFLSGFSNDDAGGVCAAIAPHAGWYYSGKVAAKAIARLDRNADTVAVIGGHLPAGYPPLFAMEDAVSTPLGNMAIDADLRAALSRETGGMDDRFPDKTVEVLLPMARFFFPGASLRWLRLPAELSSFKAGGAIARLAKELGRRVAVVGSTDLTHYGPSYGFMPKGMGREALHWVREVNDRRFIEAVESGDPAAALERAETDRSSCSAGAVLAAMGFASAKGAAPPRLLEYATSADANDSPEPPPSFVGYAAMAMGNDAS